MQSYIHADIHIYIYTNRIMIFIIYIYIYICLYSHIGIDTATCMSAVDRSVGPKWAGKSQSGGSKQTTISFDRVAMRPKPIRPTTAAGAGPGGPTAVNKTLPSNGFRKLCPLPQRGAEPGQSRPKPTVNKVTPRRSAKGQGV